jgi:putative phosphoesterase
MTESKALHDKRIRPAAPMKVGLISDTHGVLRSEALDALAGVEAIIHAGDIGASEVLEALRAVAPVHAVRGNNDRGAWARGVPQRLALRLGGIGVHVLHDLQDLNIDAAAAGFQVVVAGHSHKPGVALRQGVLFVNPGSAGPRRFKLPVTIGYLVIADGSAAAKIRDLI